MSRPRRDCIKATVMIEWVDAESVLADLHEHTAFGSACPLCNLADQIREAVAARSSGTGKRKEGRS